MLVMTPAEVALQIVEQVFPLLLDAIEKAVAARQDPMKAAQSVLDGEEAAAIARETIKFSEAPDEVPAENPAVG